MLLSVLVVSVACFALYWGSDVVHERIAKGLQDVAEYFSGGDKDTSLGIRISLLRANWILFLKSPLYGWGFQGVPALASIPEIAAFLTPLFESFFVRSGGHNELMQSMMRMGILGLASRLLLFGVPLVVFAQAVRSPVARRRTAGYLGLIVVIGYLTASASMEVFNLIYAASFYGLLVATFAGVALDPESDMNCKQLQRHLRLLQPGRVHAPMRGQPGAARLRPGPAGGRGQRLERRHPGLPGDAAPGRPDPEPRQPGLRRRLDPGRARPAGRLDGGDEQRRPGVRALAGQAGGRPRRPAG